MSEKDIKSYPSLQQQGKNLAKFTFELIKHSLQSGALLVSDEVKQERLAICNKCEWYDESQDRCKECGCFMDQKASFAIDSCPLDKWSESNADWIEENFDQLMNKIEENVERVATTPQFPAKRNVGDEYTWKDNTWKWNGYMWDLITEKKS
jgi:hypothetical protein